MDAMVRFSARVHIRDSPRLLCEGTAVSVAVSMDPDQFWVVALSKAPDTATTSVTLAGRGEKTVTHTYATPGAKEITLVATDSDGASSASTSRSPARSGSSSSAGPTSPVSAGGSTARVKLWVLD